MKDFVIEFTKDGKLLKTAFKLPGCWDEVPKASFQPLVTLYLKTPEQMDEYDKTVRAFVLLAGVEAWPVIQELEAEELYPLLAHVDWVFNKLDVSQNNIPELAFTKGLLKKLVLIGPGDGLDNIRFGEWVVADGYFVDYAQNNNPEALDSLIAVIYRPAGIGSAYNPIKPDYRGDKREKFNDQTLERRTKLMSQVKEETKKAIFVWYASCRQQIITRFPHFFPTSAKGTENTEGWFGLYDDLMGDPKFGGAEKLEDTFVNTVFASMDRSVVKMNELKDKYDL